MNQIRLRESSKQQLIISFPGTVTPTSLNLQSWVSYQDWSLVGKRLAEAKEFMAWALGDWLNHGEKHYGETYAQAASETGIPEDTLMILKHVSSKVSPEIRIKNLSWSHHRLVAKLPPEEQRARLKEAVDNAWTVREFTKVLKEKVADSEKTESAKVCECCGASPASARVCSGCVVMAFAALGKSTEQANNRD